MILQANDTQRKENVAILISEKTNFKTKKVTRDKDGHFITYLKGEIHSFTIIVGDFTIPLMPMDRSSPQKVNKETSALNDTSNQMDLVFLEPSIPKKQNTHSSQVDMQHSQG